MPVANSDRRAIETLEPWQDSSGKMLARREKDAKDIIVDDLSATLEAHRASNRAAVIRKIKIESNSDLAGPILRPLLRENGDGGSKAKKTQEGKEYEVHQMWPADSVQAKVRYGKTGSRDFVKSRDPLEYTGVVQWPKQAWEISDSPKNMPLQRPWLAYLDTTNEGYLERLTNEIKAYEAYMRLSPQEEAASRLVISDVNSVARNEPEIKPLTLLGSRSTGLATPISDFDFTFTLPISLPGGWILPPSEADASQAQSFDRDNKLKAVKALKKMDRHFRSSAKFSNIDFVRHARVPIIRSKHVATGLDVQIQTMAPYQAAQEYTVTYLSEFPSLRPLYIILRYCLEIRDLTTVFEGGLGSYSILMMIVTAMKHSSGKFASDDLAGQLLHVLEFYGKADLYKVGLSANPPRLFEKQKEGWSLKERTARMADSQLSGIDKMQTYYPRKPYLLCLQDPANDLNDLGKNAYAIKHIQATFNQARESIQVSLENQKDMSDDRAKGGIWSCLDSLVRADYTQFELRRNRVEQCANPRKLDDQDHSKETIRKDFKEWMNQYTGVAEDDIYPKTALQAVGGIAAESTEAVGGLGDGARHVWYRKWLARSRERLARKERKRAREKAIVAEKNQRLQRLHGINDDEYGWEPSSPSNQKTLLQAIAVPKSALAARASASKRVPHTQNQDRDI